MGGTAKFWLLHFDHISSENMTENFSLKALVMLSQSFFDWLKFQIFWNTSNYPKSTYSTVSNCRTGSNKSVQACYFGLLLHKNARFWLFLANFCPKLNSRTCTAIRYWRVINLFLCFAKCGKPDHTQKFRQINFFI